MTGSSKSRTLRAGVVGAGAFGRLHSEKYARLDGVTLVAVADPDIAKAEAVARAFGAEGVADHRALVGKVDIVTIAAPAVTHGRIARDFLAAGIHVFVEKPLAATLHEADALIAEAERRRLVLGCGHQERYVAAELGLLQRGRPRLIECHRAGPFTGRGMDVSVVLDLMIHDLDLVHQLTPADLLAVTAGGRSQHGATADEVEARLHFADGAIARVFASRIAPERKRSLTLTYADGVVALDFLSRKVTNTTGRDLACGLGAHEASPVMADPLGFGVARFVEAVRGGIAPLVRPREARKALDTALRVNRAVDAGALAAVSAAQ